MNFLLSSSFPIVPLLTQHLENTANHYYDDSRHCRWFPFRWRHGGDTGVDAMPVAKLTKRTVDAISADDCPLIIYDTDLNI
jgi:hypothetical protein